MYTGSTAYVELSVGVSNIAKSLSIVFDLIRTQCPQKEVRQIIKDPKLVILYTFFQVIR